MGEWDSPLRPPLGGLSSSPPNLIMEFVATSSLDLPIYLRVG
jgi:hypothetical protein